MTTTSTEAVRDAERVAAAVADLSPLDREALLLRVAGRSLAQVATITGTTEAMVRVRIHRAATAVEKVVGPLPLDDAALPVDGRSTDDQVIDAELGVTPVLHTRLRAAVTASRQPTTPRHRRIAALRERMVDHLPRLAPTAGAVAAIAATGVAMGALT